MRSIEIFFESPMLLVLLVPVCLLVVGAWRLWRRQEGERHVERLAMGLRMTEAVLLVLIAAGLCVVTHSDHSHTVVLTDRSASMQEVQADVDALAQALAAQSAAGRRVDVLDFAGDAGVLAQEDGLTADATDIAAAIEAAEKKMNADVSRRIILLSDGAATDGDMLAAVERLAQQGVRVDAVHFDTAVRSPQAQIDELVLPAHAAQGERFCASVSVWANTDMKGTLRISDGEEAVHEEEVELHAGDNSFSVMLTAAEAGEHVYRAEFICAEDTAAQNNSRLALMQVSSSTKVLLVDGTGNEAAQLAALMADGGFDVEITAPQQLPDTTSALCRYGLIVLMNVDNADLPQGSAQRLREYVSEYGRSVLTTGGENTYIYGGMKDTPFEEFLPVRMSVEEKESVDPVALMLVIDVTDSMARQSSGTPIEMARRGAIKCVDALNANDYAGVITFSDDARVLVDMTAMDSKEEIIAAINGIKTDDPNKLTRFSGALKTACDTLKAFDKLEKKHIIFITDGSPADGKEGFDGIVREMRANGITLSTIAVGRIMNVVKLLEGLSAIGGGRCYFVEGASDLPDIMSTDTVLSQVEYTIDEPFIPQAAPASFASGGDEPLTQLYGYIRTTAKPGAQTLLETPQGRPVFVQQRMDGGIAASFMSDLSGNWSRAWFAGEKSRAMMLKMIKALTPDTLVRADTDIRLETGGQRGRLLLNNEQQEAYAIQAEITSPGGRKTTVEFDWIQGELYEAAVMLEETGIYRISVIWRGEDGETLETRETAAVFDWSSEYDMKRRVDGAAALMELVSTAGGAMSSSAQELMAVDLGTTQTEHDATLPMAILIMLFLLADITVRRTKLKRLRGKMKKSSDM